MDLNHGPPTRMNWPRILAQMPNSYGLPPSRCRTRQTCPCCSQASDTAWDTSCRLNDMNEVIETLKNIAPVASVVIALMAFTVSLLTYRRAWRWRAEAEPTFVHVQGDRLLCPDFSKAGINPVIVGWLTNCGDGRAFNVKAIGIDCEAEIWDCRQIGETVLGKQTEWVMTNTGRITELTNENMRFWVTITPPRNPRRDYEPDLTKIGLGVHWVSSPTRLRRCRYRHLPFWGIEPWKCGPFGYLKRRYRDIRGHRKFHALDSKRASEQKKLLS